MSSGDDIQAVRTGLPASPCFVSAVAVVTLIVFLAPGFSQTNLDQVHITPQTITATKSPSESGPSLDAAARPLKVNVDLVLVPVTITDPLNRPVLGLDQENFRVYENKQLQAIRHFSTEDVPISVGVILDMSGSMGAKIERARQAVIEFLKTANPQDEFFLMTFADRPQESVEFTNSIDEIQTRLLNMTPKGRTALIDAVYMGVSTMRRARCTKKALLVISDGGDNHSRYTESELKHLLKETDVMTYAIGIYDRYFSTEEELLGPALLSDVSELTGGHTVTIDNPNDLADAAIKIGSELRNQYVIGYRPQSRQHDGKWHKIKIKLLPPKGLPPLRTYAKQGYYAPDE